MKVSFVSNIDKKIIQENPSQRKIEQNPNPNPIPKKIPNTNKKFDNYSSYTNRANTVKIKINNILFFIFNFQSFANKSLNRNDNNNERSFSNRTHYLKSKEKCKKKLNKSNIKLIRLKRYFKNKRTLYLICKKCRKTLK